MKRIIFFSIFLCAMMFQFSLNAQTTYTLGINNSSWDNINAWSPTGIPGPGDFVVIHEFNVTISGSHEIAGFYLDNGTILFADTGKSSLTVTDSSTWSSGSFKGGGNNSLIFAEGSVVNIVEDPAHPYHHLYETTYLTNRGTIKLQGTVDFGIRGNSILKNEGLFDVMSDADFSGESFSGGTFINTGTFRKSGGTDITSFNLWWVFQNNGGTIDVKSGTLQFKCDGTFSDGNYNADLDAKLEFLSNTQVFKGTLSGAPAGDIILNGSYISSDSADVTLDFKGKGFQFSDGYLTGKGTFIIPKGALFVLPGTEIEPILGDATTLLNQGTIRMEGENDFIINGNAIVDNQSLFDVTSDADFSGSQISGGTFHNTGTLRKSGGSDVTSFNRWWDFQNDGGTIDVKSGTLQFSCNGTFSDGNYNADLGAKMEFITGTQVFQGTLSGAPAGDIILNGSYISSDSAEVTLDFKGKGFQFSYGYLTGGGTFIIPDGALFVLPGDHYAGLYGGTTLQNQGTIRMEGENAFIINGHAIVDNQSLFDVTSDADFSGSQISGGTFLNTGTLRKSGGDGVTQCNLWWDFHNNAGGIIDIQSGEIEFTSSQKFENAQGGIIQGIDSIKVPSNFSNDGIISPGNSHGILTYIDNFLPSSTAILDIQLGGLTPGKEYDQLSVTGGAKLNGTLKISLIDGFIPAKGDSFVVLTTTAAITDSFATIDAQSGLYLTVKKNSNNITIFVDSVGTITSVENNKKAEIVTSYNLSQNYPNPFNPSTTISWQSPVDSWQTLKVYDILGKEVAVLVDEFRQAGRNQVKFDASRLASGVYIYRITAGKFSSVKKMLLQK